MSVLTYPDAKPYDWTKAKARDRVMWGRDGQPVRALDGVYVTGSLFVIAWLDWVDALCFRRFGVHIVVIQPPFNVGVALSAGTHDGDGCMDVYIPGVGWWRAQWFLRSKFGAFWFRHTGSWASPRAWHLHGFPFGVVKHGLPVGIYVPGQETDYTNRAYGLAGLHTPGSDGSRFPKVRTRVWPFDAYVQEMIAAMPLNDADVAKVADAVVAKLLSAQVGPTDDKVTVRSALYRASNVPGIIRAKVDRIMAKIGATDA